MSLLGCGYHICEVADDSIALTLGNTNDCGDEARVKEQAVPAGDGVCSDQRVLCSNGVSADGTTKGS